MHFDRDRFTRLVHHICHRAADPRQLGRVKLNKILWFADMLHFERTGKPLTGATYAKRQHGPCPTQLLPALDDLKAAKKIVERPPQGQYEPHQYFSTEQPDLSVFTAEQIAMVDLLIESICTNHTATSISAATHDRIWELAEIGEEIPYAAFLASRLGEVNEADVRLAKRELLGEVA